MLMLLLLLLLSLLLMFVLRGRVTVGDGVAPRQTCASRPKEQALGNV